MKRKIISLLLILTLFAGMIPAAHASGECICTDECADGSPNSDCDVCLANVADCEGLPPSCNCTDECIEGSPKADCPVCTVNVADCEGLPPSCNCTYECVEGSPKEDCPICTVNVADCEGLPPTCNCTVECVEGSPKADCPICAVNVADCEGTPPTCSCTDKCKAGAVDDTCELCKRGNLTKCEGLECICTEQCTAENENDNCEKCKGGHYADCEVVNYGIWIEGKQLNSKNTPNFRKGISYDADNAILTLNNANISVNSDEGDTNVSAILVDGVDLTIKLSGENSINANFSAGAGIELYGILGDSDLIIEGPGRLAISLTAGTTKVVDSRAICVFGDLCLDAGAGLYIREKADPPAHGISAVNVEVINDSTVEVFASESAIDVNPNCPDSFVITGDKSADASYAEDVGTMDKYVKLEPLKGKFNYNYEFKPGHTLIVNGMPKADPTRPDGYTFCGWFDNEACTGTPIDESSVAPHSMYYASWKKTISISAKADIGATYDGTPKKGFNDENITYSPAGTYSLSVEYELKQEDGTYAPITGEPTDAGVYKIILSAEGDAGAGETELSFTIARKKVTLLGLGVKDKEYDATRNGELDYDPAELEFSPAVEGLEPDFTDTKVTFDNKNVGKDKRVIIDGIKLKKDGVATENYAISPKPEATASITPRPLGITLTALDKDYDGEPNMKVIGKLVETDIIVVNDKREDVRLTEEDVGGVAYTDAKPDPNASDDVKKEIRDYKFTLSGNNAGNYELTLPKDDEPQPEAYIKRRLIKPASVVLEPGTTKVTDVIFEQAIANIDLSKGTDYEISDARKTPGKSSYELKLKLKNTTRANNFRLENGPDVPYDGLFTRGEIVLDIVNLTSGSPNLGVTLKDLESVLLPNELAELVAGTDYVLRFTIAEWTQSQIPVSNANGLKAQVKGGSKEELNAISYIYIKAELINNDPVNGSIRRIYDFDPSDYPILTVSIPNAVKNVSKTGYYISSFRVSKYFDGDYDAISASAVHNNTALSFYIEGLHEGETGIGQVFANFAIASNIMKNSSGAKTGDESNIPLMIGLLSASLIGIGAVAFFLLKKGKNGTIVKALPKPRKRKDR